jgi:hypothetical protein
VVNSKKGERYATQKIPAGGVGFEFFVNRPRDLELLDPQSKQETLNMNPTVERGHATDTFNPVPANIMYLHEYYEIR